MPKRRDLRERFEEKFVRDPSGCWLWTGAIGTHGYGVIGVGPHMVKTAHRISLLIYRGIDADENFVCHRCDVKACVNPDHLYVGTVKDNARDLMERGNPYLEIRKHITSEVETRRVKALPRGIKHHRSAAKINDDIALAIYRAQGSQQAIADEFGLCQQTVSQIKRRKTWRHVHANT